jgi:hypothetical protein
MEIKQTVLWDTNSMIDYINTYYWHQRVISSQRMTWKKWFGSHPSNYFKVGNAGDLFIIDLLQYLYGCSAKNTDEAKGRLLIVGSIAHRVKPYDILCGIGVRDTSIPLDIDPSNIKVYGLRGPITEQYFKQNNFDLKSLKFLLDPGLMARFVYPENSFPKVSADQVIFIPHYRERFDVRKKIPKGIKFVDVDNSPRDVIKEIIKSKLVYSSSLHGIIFAHAYNRPAILVRPQTKEPLIKFEDYYLSVGFQMPVPIDSILNANFLNDSDTPPGLKYMPDDFYFPTVNEIRNMGGSI